MPRALDIARIATVFLALALVAGEAWAQAGPTTIQFSFSNPGARSLGLGGAFVPLADDATAAFANPAGLLQLVRAEISVEGRLWGYTTPFTVGGRLSGLPSGIGLDQTAGLRVSESSDTLSGLSYLSFVYPSEKWSLAVYRHQWASFEGSSNTQGFFGDSPDISTRPRVRCGPDTYRVRDFTAFNELEIVNYGASGAYQMSEKLSIGGGLSLYDGTFDNRGEFFALVDANHPQGCFGPSISAPEARILTASDSVDDTAWGFNAGALFELSSHWKLGGVYRRGPNFRISAEERSGPILDLPEGTILFSDTCQVRMPDVVALGIAFKSENGAVTVSFEWDRVMYSNIPDSLGASDEVELNDGNELHLGGEYAFIEWVPAVALRFGLWLDPDHSILALEGDALEKALFRGGEDELHVAFGFGLAFQSFQVDLGVDLSKLVDTASVSAIFTF